VQCGFCTPGQIMSVVTLLKSNPNPDEAAIRQAIQGNLCRCGTYTHIIEAAKAAAGQA
jgi:aerobic-type carbon monoxide dehydrogenase small subunit (CoxS/CutS family)